MFDELAREILSKPGALNGPALLGLSGGADSVFLFHVLVMAGVNFKAVHINHGLRGKEADADEAFVREICKEHNIELVVRRENVAALAKEAHKGLEQMGRMVRYEEFFNQAEPGAVLYLAHHANDLTETLLMNFLRGSGLKGMSGIKPESVITNGEKKITILRPLLNITHEQIKAELIKRGLSWQEDSTNAEADCTRNKLRLEIIPQIEKIYPGFGVTARRSAVTFGEIEDFLELNAKAFYEKNVSAPFDNARSVNADKLSALHPALKKTVIRRMIEEIDTLTDISFQNIESIMSLCDMQSGRSVKLPRRLNACKSFCDIVIFSGDLIIEDDTEPVVEYFSRTDRAIDLKDKNCRYFDYDKIRAVSSSQVIVRKPKEGDYLFIDNDGHKKLLSTYLKQEKIPAYRRADILVVACDNLVLYVNGHRNSEGFLIDENTVNVLKITKIT